MRIDKMNKAQLIEHITALEEDNKRLKQEVHALITSDTSKLITKIELLERELETTTERLEEIEEEKDTEIENRNKALAELEDDFYEFVKEFNRFINGESCPNHIKELEYLTKSIETICYN